MKNLRTDGTPLGSEHALQLAPRAVTLGMRIEEHEDQEETKLAAESSATFDCVPCASLFYSHVVPPS